VKGRKEIQHVYQCGEIYEGVFEVYRSIESKIIIPC
jgi:hypothetical protein